MLACTTDKPSPVDHCLGHIEMCVCARARADLTLDELVYELSERRRDLYGGRLLLGRRALTGHLPADQLQLLVLRTCAPTQPCAANVSIG